jgi:hypothetical protein
MWPSDERPGQEPWLADVDEARIRATFTDDPTQSWRSSAQQLVHNDIDGAGLKPSSRKADPGIRLGH